MGDPMTLTIDGATCAVVPKQATDAMVDAVVSAHLAAEVRRPVHDVEREAVEPALAAAPPEPLAAILEMREALAEFVTTMETVESGARFAERMAATHCRVRAILARITTGETTDAG